MMDTRQQMERARALIKAKQYNEARAILNKTHHPKAREWITKIDTLQPKRKGRGLWWKLPLLLLACVFTLCVGMVFYGIESQRAASGQATLTAIRSEYCSSLYRVGSDRWDSCMEDQ